MFRPCCRSSRLKAKWCKKLIKWVLRKRILRTRILWFYFILIDFSHILKDFVGPLSLKIFRTNLSKPFVVFSTNNRIRESCDIVNEEIFKWKGKTGRLGKQYYWILPYNRFLYTFWYLKIDNFSIWNIFEMNRKCSYKMFLYEWTAEMAGKWE